MNERVVVVTGAGGALGAVVMAALIEQKLRVVALDRHVLPGDDDQRKSIAADLTTAAAAKGAIDAARVAFGRIDGLVHVMGAFAGGTSIAETTDETWASMIDINLNAAFYLLRAVLGPMRAQRDGRVVCIGSRSALEPSPNYAAYAVSKAALVALVQNAAAEMKGTGVTVNAILPSTIDTPANRAAMPDADASKWVTPRAIADLVGYLVSPQARDVSGAAIPIYGGA